MDDAELRIVELEAEVGQYKAIWSLLGRYLHPGVETVRDFSSYSPNEIVAVLTNIINNSKMQVPGLRAQISHLTEALVSAGITPPVPPMIVCMHTHVPATGCVTCNMPTLDSERYTMLVTSYGLYREIFQIIYEELHGLDINDSELNPKETAKLMSFARATMHLLAAVVETGLGLDTDNARALISRLKSANTNG